MKLRGGSNQGCYIVNPDGSIVFISEEHKHQYQQQLYQQHQHQQLYQQQQHQQHKQQRQGILSDRNEVLIELHENLTKSRTIDEN